MTSMNSVEMHYQIQIKAKEQLKKWDERFKKLEERHTRGLKRARRLINYDAFELAGGPSPTRATSEEEPSSPSESGSSGSQHSAGAHNTGSKFHEVQESSEDRLNSTTRGDHPSDEDEQGECDLEQY